MTPRTSAGKALFEDGMWKAESKKVTRAFRLATEQYVVRAEAEARAAVIAEVRAALLQIPVVPQGSTMLHHAGQVDLISSVFAILDDAATPAGEGE